MVTLVVDDVQNDLVCEQIISQRLTKIPPPPKNNLNVMAHGTWICIVLYFLDVSFGKM